MLHVLSRLVMGLDGAAPHPRASAVPLTKGNMANHRTALQTSAQISLLLISPPKANHMTIANFKEKKKYNPIMIIEIFNKYFLLR